MKIVEPSAPLPLSSPQGAHHGQKAEPGPAVPAAALAAVRAVPAALTAVQGGQSAVGAKHLQELTEAIQRNIPRS